MKAFAVKFLASLTPNRVALYVTALANVTGALIPVVTDVGASSLTAPLVGINAGCLMFLRGWQQWEKHCYEAEQLQFVNNAQAEARAQASAPRSGIQVPKR